MTVRAAHRPIQKLLLRSHCVDAGDVAFGNGVSGQGAQVELQVTLHVGQAGPVGMQTRAGVLSIGSQGTGDSCMLT